MQDKLRNLFLQINNNSISIEIGTQAILEVLNEFRPIYFEYDGISDDEPMYRPGNDGVIAIANAIAEYQGPIYLLALTNCDLGDQGVAAIARVLPQTLIRLLDLSSNSNRDDNHPDMDTYITGDGASAIAKVLPRTQITDLNLAFNYIDDAGITAIANVLGQTKVISLNFYNCNIEKGCVMAFAKTLSSCPQLMFLDLSDDYRTSDDQCDELIDVIHAELSNRRETLGRRIAELFFIRNLPKYVEQTFFNLLPQPIFEMILKLAVQPYFLTPEYLARVEHNVNNRIQDQNLAGTLTVVPESFHVRNHNHFFQQTPKPDVSIMLDRLNSTIDQLRTENTQLQQTIILKDEKFCDLERRIHLLLSKIPKEVLFSLEQNSDKFLPLQDSPPLAAQQDDNHYEINEENKRLRGNGKHFDDSDEKRPKTDSTSLGM